MYNVATWGIYKYHISLTGTNIGNFPWVQEALKSLLAIHVLVPEYIESDNWKDHEMPNENLKIILYQG